MAAHPITDERYPPIYSKRFTSFASQLVLHLDTVNGGAAPAIQSTSGFGPAISHLPSQVVVEVTTADTHFDYIDSAGALVAMNFDAVGTYILRMAPTSIETTTTVAAVTVFWSQKG